jgi:hypothetical protein
MNIPAALKKAKIKKSTACTGFLSETTSSDEITKVIEKR